VNSLYSFHNDASLFSVVFHADFADILHFDFVVKHVAGKSFQKLSHVVNEGEESGL
jgi:hypothetical protein